MTGKKKHNKGKTKHGQSPAKAKTTSTAHASTKLFSAVGADSLSTSAEARSRVDSEAMEDALRSLISLVDSDAPDASPPDAPTTPAGTKQAFEKFGLSPRRTPPHSVIDASPKRLRPSLLALQSSELSPPSNIGSPAPPPLPSSLPPLLNAKPPLLITTPATPPKTTPPAHLLATPSHFPVINAGGVGRLLVPVFDRSAEEEQTHRLRVSMELRKEKEFTKESIDKWLAAEQKRWTKTSAEVEREKEQDGEVAVEMEQSDLVSDPSQYYTSSFPTTPHKPTRKSLRESLYYDATEYLSDVDSLSTAECADEWEERWREEQQMRLGEEEEFVEKEQEEQEEEEWSGSEREPQSEAEMTFSHAEIDAMAEAHIQKCKRMRRREQGLYSKEEQEQGDEEKPLVEVNIALEQSEPSVDDQKQVNAPVKDVEEQSKEQAKDEEQCVEQTTTSESEIIVLSSDTEITIVSSDSVVEVLMPEKLTAEEALAQWEAAWVMEQEQEQKKEQKERKRVEQRKKMDRDGYETDAEEWDAQTSVVERSQQEEPNFYVELAKWRASDAKYRADLAAWERQVAEWQRGEERRGEGVDRVDLPAELPPPCDLPVIDAKPSDVFASSVETLFNESDSGRIDPGSLVDRLTKSMAYFEQRSSN